jgi:hypothetical protein
MWDIACPADFSFLFLFFSFFFLFSFFFFFFLFSLPARSKTVLANNKNPTYPSDVPHVYDDKYLLAEFLTNTALAAELNTLELLGLNAKGLKQLKEWSDKRSITFRFKAEEYCDFIKEVTREEEDPTKYVREYSGILGGGKRTDKVITKITEWFWKFRVEYELSAYVGNNPDEKVVLQKRSGHTELMTTSKARPRGEKVIRDALEVNLTYLFQQISAETKFKFEIDRSQKSCHTPRRNQDISRVMSHFSSLYSWCTRVHSYFTKELFPVQQNNALDMTSLNIKTIFNPVVPLYEERDAPLPAIANGEEEAVAEPALVPVASTGAEGSKAILPLGDVNLFLDEEKRSISAKCVELAEIFPQEEKLITMAEASICVALLHAKDIAQHHLDGVEYIEDMLRKQIIAAIGKEVTPVDFQNYMVYHNRKVFKEQYQPQPFCYAIRRPNHYPEGIVSIEAELHDGSIPKPIHTIVSRQETKAPLKFSIHAAANVSFTGEAFLHAFVDHKFSGSSGMSLNLNARARQFSSFLVLIGKISGPGQFEPQYGMIVKDKDDITIPIATETIPSPKEFSDSIASLSPEQQRFAKAYRSMQLASTLFAVCVIQIKPQLEKLLKLPYDALTKEIQLTQDLQELFIKYHIPSDLLSFGGEPGVSDAGKLQAVKDHVKAMHEMIQSSKEKEITETAEKAVYSVLTGQARAQEGVLVATSTGRVVGRASSKTSSSKEGASSKPKSSGKEVSDPNVVDYTKIPGELDAKFEKLDEDSALRPTILSAGNMWKKRFKKGLLADFETATWEQQQQKLEKQRVYDLLDALTKSGVLSIEGASLHVVMAATHCFDKNLLNTLVQDNVNPIEKVERSNLIVATTIHNVDSVELLKESELERVKKASPMMFEGGGGAPAIEGGKNSNN